MSAFPEVEKIVYEGPDSKNLLAFHHYNPEEVVEGKTMREIADTLDVTESRVCQIHGNIMRRLECQLDREQLMVG